MKISNSRLENAKELRDAALRIVSRSGYEVLVGESERPYFHRLRGAKTNDLTILVSSPERGRLLDIWQNGRGKVFSIAWDVTPSPYVMAFAAGHWQNTLRNADAALTWRSVKCSSQLKKWLRGDEALDD